MPDYLKKPIVNLFVRRKLKEPIVCVCVSIHGYMYESVLCAVGVYINQRK